MPEPAAANGADWSSIQPGLVGTRNTIIDTLELLAEHREAITLIGSHAVHERTSTLPGVDSTTTKDGDFAITPELVSDHPAIEETMRSAGFEPITPDRPGLWCRGFDERGQPVDEIDLLAPAALAGRGTRSVKPLSAAHGKTAVGRVSGIELAVYDRDLIQLQSFDGSGRVTQAYVAGTAALVCAKTYKLYERIAERDAGKKNRVQAKDASDLWRLIATSNGADVKSVFEKYDGHAEIGDSVRKGAQMLTSLIHSGEVIRLAESNIGPQVAPGRIAADFARWFIEYSG